MKKSFLIYFYLLKNFEIIFISNMDKTKGWPKLLRACKILDKKNMDFRCSFIGAWQCKKDEKDFCNFIDNYNLKNKIKYLGEKIGKEKNKILEDSDVLVFPTEYKLETFGRVILEAMMFGLPVIANGIASIPTIIQNEKTGFVLIKNSPEEIAEKIELLIKSKNKQKDLFFDFLLIFQIKANDNCMEQNPTQLNYIFFSF